MVARVEPEVLSVPRGAVQQAGPSDTREDELGGRVIFEKTS